MIFQGIPPKIRYTDPNFFRYELRLHWQYLVARMIEMNEQMRKVLVNFGVSMKMAGESFRRMYRSLNKENS